MKHNIKEIVERFKVIEDLYYTNDDGVDMHIVEEIIQSHIDTLDDLVEEIEGKKKFAKIISSGKSGVRDGHIDFQPIQYNQALQDTISTLLKRKEELKELIK